MGAITVGSESGRRQLLLCNSSIVCHGDAGFPLPSIFTRLSGLDVKRIFIALIRCYQLCISPLFAPNCRFSPTCSQYAIEALVHHGTFRGLYLATRRLLRCHPFHPGGFDPVDKSF